MSYENIIFEETNGIATITFNRPKALNALNSDTLSELGQALDAVAADENIRVLVLTGSGDKAFIAGADIAQMSAFNPLQAKQFARMGHDVIGRLQALPIPVIAAVNCFALGGGTEMALACDFIYAADTAMFGQPEINLGIIPGFGGTQRLARLIGINKAKELILTGRNIKAQEAFEMGLVNRICPPAELMDAVMKTAGVMASKGKVTVRAAKQAINTGLNVDLATGCAIEVDAFGLCLASPDAKEGMTAFLEKRKADFTGKLNE